MQPFSPTQDMELGRLTGTGIKNGIDISPGSHGRLVNGLNAISKLKGGLGSGTVGVDISHHRLNAGNTMEIEDAPKYDQGEQGVEKRTGENDQASFSDMFVRKRQWEILRGHLGIVFITDHLDESSQGYQREAVVGSANLLSQDPGPKSEGKLFDADPKKTGDQKVSQLMKKNQRAQYDDN
jgi:hypothetical protein